eukprot:10183381-Lingulodinium_polyedra.AAC.1
MPVQQLLPWAGPGGKPPSHKARLAADLTTLAVIPPKLPAELMARNMGQCSNSGPLGPKPG